MHCKKQSHKLSAMQFLYNLNMYVRTYTKVKGLAINTVGADSTKV